MAAGLGTRLRPLTDHTPKCLVEVGGTTLLDRWLDTLADGGVDEVLVNVHHLADQVVSHVARRGDRPRVRIVHEPVLLGSAGTLRANHDFVDGEEMFLAVNADNLTDFDVQRLVKAHREGGAPATVTAFHADDPTRCGVLEVRDGVLVGFQEKPQRPRGHLANAGIYAFHPDVLGLVEGPTPRDLGHHLLPRLVGRARVVDLGEAYLRDIGSPEALERARVEWADWEGGHRA
nr:nucleotidyltransferase family protein [Nocardioides panaciterrulae]